jgi:ribosome-associated translation inhibitor RaiA
MHTTPPPFPVSVHTGWIDFSPALHSYASTRVTRTLGTFAARIRSVAVRVIDHEPYDPATRLCAIDVELKPVGTLSATSTGRDIYESVDQATETILARLRGTLAHDDVEPLLSRIA